jgi:hypothetical protein
MMNLEEKKRLLKEKLDNLGIVLKKDKIDKVGFVKKNLTKAILRSIEDVELKEAEHCPAVELRLPIQACLARTFIKDHPCPKSCEKCKKFYKYVDLLYERINNNEKS